MDDSLGSLLATRDLAAPALPVSLVDPAAFQTSRLGDYVQPVHDRRLVYAAFCTLAGSRLKAILAGCCF